MKKKNKKNTPLKVTLNWVGYFELLVCILGIILFIWFDIFMFTVEDSEGKTILDSVGLLIFFSISTVLVIIFSVLNIIHLISDRVIVHGKEVIIKSAFRKPQKINVSEITCYSNTERIGRSHRYKEISIYIGEKEAIAIRNDIYKNFELLLYYLSKNCKPKDYFNVLNKSTKYR